MSEPQGVAGRVLDEIDYWSDDDALVFGPAYVVDELSAEARRVLREWDVYLEPSGLEPEGFKEYRAIREFTERLGLSLTDPATDDPQEEATDG